MKPGATGAMGAIGAIGAATFVLAIADVQAQAPAELSLAQAVKMALEREPSLRAARAEIEAMRGMRQQAALRPNPTLTFERREEPAGTDNQTIVQVSLPLDLFRRSARIEAAESEVLVAEQSAADDTRALVRDVKLKYAEAAAALRDRATSGELAESARLQLELLTHRVSEGSSPPLDRDQLSVEVRRFESERIRAAARGDTAMFELKRVLGLAPSATVTLRDTLDALAGDAAQIAPIPSSQRPDVLEAQARVTLADARIGEAQSAGRVDLSLFGSYTRMDAGFPQRGFSETGELQRVRGVFNYASAGAMVMLPLWNRNQGGVASARAQRSAAAARLEAAQLAAESDRAAAMLRVEQTEEALELIAGGVRLARQNLNVVRQTFELGRGTLGDVITEQRRYLEIEREYTSAMQAAVEARALLAFAQGEQQ